MTEQIRKLGPLGLPQRFADWDQEITELEQEVRARQADPAEN
jgi:hypothetical protein